MNNLAPFYENLSQYYTDPSVTSASASVNNCYSSSPSLDSFLLYADHLLNSFATVGSSQGSTSLKTPGAYAQTTSKHAKELVDYLPPHDAEGNQSGASSFSYKPENKEDNWQLSRSQMMHAGQIQNQPLPYATAAPVGKQEYRLCVRAPALGTFYLFTRPERTIGEIIPEIERVSFSIRILSRPTHD